MLLGRPNEARVLQASTRIELLHLLQQDVPRTMEQLVACTGRHPNTVREHVAQLIAAGFVTATPERRSTRGRPRMIYTAAIAAGSDSPVMAQRRRDAIRQGDLMRRLYPDADTTPGDAAAAHQIDMLDDHLQRNGFDPEFHGLSVALTRCPLASAADVDQAIRCRVCLTLARTVLAYVGGPLVARSLASDTAPCTLTLGAAPDDT